MKKTGEDIVAYSMEELREMRRRGLSRTRDDAPTFPVDPDFWENARVVYPEPTKKSVHLRLDTDVLEWFRDQGKGHLTRMNAVLRSYMDAHAQPKPKRRKAAE